MKTYYVVYKLYQAPGLDHFECVAQNKAQARLMFLETGKKHDYIIKVIT